jgi:Tol biopolymer transport system component
MMRSLHLMARRTAAVVAVSLGVVLTVPVVAGAAFPGTNGVIAFVTTRGNNVAIDQVDPNGAGIGTSTGDLANTTSLTAGAVDAEPFYSPDGTEVAFSSNRTGRWAIYEIGQTDTDESTPAAEISQVNGSETHDDYGPSFSDDGNTVVFNRDNKSIYSVYLPSGVSSACDLYDPSGGLAGASGDNGASSRVVFDPADPTKLVYVAGNNHIHLLSGVVVPSAAHPCPAETALTDVDLSATATGGTALGQNQADANPDWSPDGTKIIFDSTRAGGHSLWYFTNPTSASPTVAALWPGLAGSTTTSDTQPVFSPDGTHIAYTQPVLHNGTQVIDYESNVFGAPQSSQTDLTMGAGSSANSQPDWQPLAPGPNLPEAPTILLLPGSALIVGGGYWLMKRRRSLLVRPAHVGGAPR